MTNLNEVLHIKNQTLKAKNKEINALRVKVKELTTALAEEVGPCPPFGKSCCEEAQLTANELARRNEELAESEGEIAALTKRAEKAERAAKTLGKTMDRWALVLVEATGSRDVMNAELDGDWQVVEERLLAMAHEKLTVRAEVERLTRERDEARAERDRAHALAESRLGYPPLDLRHADLMNRAERAEAERDELQAKLDDAEGWPEWLGPKIDPDECDLDSKIIAPGYGVKELRERAHDFARKAGEAEAAARRREAMERDREQAATGDEDQRVEELFELVTGLIDLEPLDPDLVGSIHDGCRAAVNAGWTRPESEASE